ncbi:MAG TPA: post-COAP-1 domain-containing protein [Pyrinomonadaceae bacterium]|jgi:PKD repeat protein
MKRYILALALFSALFVPIALDFNSAQAAVGLKRGPYLQRGTPTSIVVRWRTDAPTNSRVRYGLAPDALTSTVDSTVQTTEHEITVSGLSPATRYYYSVGSTDEVLSGDSQHYFVTAPPVGSTQPTRIWAFGDAGFADANQRAVRDAYYAFTGERQTDVLLLLGDNAYDFATDEQYQAGVFDMYSSLLRKTVLWSTFGNHEGFSSVSLAQFGPYYEMFTFPTAGEAGGAPSGTEAYYSFDYANIHFVCLNSHDIPRTDFGDMMNWLRRDLAQNRQQWTIAYFHHPPYSKGSHNSDNNSIPPDTPESAASIREMRAIALPILEQSGVDLVLTGHSHSYERSFLLDGHYGTSDTLTDEMKIDSGDGRISGDGFYRKTTDITADAHAGTVYAVVGTGGRPGGGSLDHPVMIESLNVLGSMVIDISGDRLDGFFLDSAGTTHDHFSIQKGALRPVAPAQQPIQDDATPDQSNGIDRDGNYTLSWTYPELPVEQPCGYGIEEATAFGPIFSDDAEELLIGTENSKWSSEGQWISSLHPTTQTRGYSVVYAVNQNTSLTMKDAVLIPAGHAAFLTFDSREDIEKNFDYGFVEVSADGGAFQTLAQYTGVFTGKRTVDLSAFAGQQVKIRFRFTSDVVTAPPQLGWFIDNIRIETSNFATIATVASSVSQFDVTGHANGTYAYRVKGFFGDCAANPTAGPYSRVRQIIVELGQTTVNPTANFAAAPNPAEVNQTITFDASSSKDNDPHGAEPEIASYFWSFGDGSTHAASTPTTTHAYAAPGVYRVTLTVTDNDGETADAEQFIEVNQPQPNTIEASGGGFIIVSGSKAHFGFEAEKSGLKTSGHLTFQDEANNIKAQSMSITSLEVINKRAIVRGSCRVNKAAGYTFTLEVADYSESGRNDTFRIRLSNGYEAVATLAGGNIKVRY